METDKARSVSVPGAMGYRSAVKDMMESHRERRLREDLAQRRSGMGGGRPGWAIAKKVTAKYSSDNSRKNIDKR